MTLETTKYLLELETEIKSIKDTEETKLRFEQLDDKIKKLEIAIKIISLQSELTASVAEAGK